MLDDDDRSLRELAAAVPTHKPLKAYAVTEEYDGTGGIFFAHHAVAARRMGANEYNDGEFQGISCRRAPWADKYAGKPVPAWVMIEFGWHFECAWSGAQIDSDWLEEKGLPVEGVVGTQNSLVFACQEYADAYAEERARCKAVEAQAIADMKAIVLGRFPSVQFTSDGSFREYAYANKEADEFVIMQVVVSFEFPGMKLGPASARYERKHGTPFEGLTAEYHCCYGDKEAFEAWAASVPSAGGAVPIPSTKSE